MIRSADEIYTALEDALENVSEPQTCAALMERPSVRAAAALRFGSDVQVATNKLSDLLGFMWRKGVLERYPAPQTSRSMARFAYMLKGRAPADTVCATALTEPLGKHALAITEKPNGEVVLDFKQFTIVIKPK